MKRLALLLLSIAVGCAGDSHQKDQQQYRKLLDAGLSEVNYVPPEPLTLDQAMLVANKSSESLAIEGEAFVRAVLQKRRSVSAFFPEVGLNPSYRARQRESGGGMDADLDIPIDARIVLFDGQQNINSYWRDVYLIERQQDRLLEAQELLLSDVAQSYYDVLRAEAQVNVLQGSLQVQGERLRDTQARQQAGTARPLDVSQTAAQFAATRVQLIDAVRSAGDARASLSYLMDAPVADSPLSDRFEPGEQVPETALLVELARSHRSELAAAERSIAAAERDVRVAVGAYYPQLAIDLSVFLHRESVPDSRTWEGLLSINFPIFTAGRIDAEVRTAWSFLREAILVKTQTQRRVEREIDQAVRNVRASQDRVRELHVQLAAATDAFNQAEGSYKAGLGTNLERITAQDAMLRAQLALATETIDQKVLWVELTRVCGTLRETFLEKTRSSLPATQPIKTGN